MLNHTLHYLYERSFNKDKAPIIFMNYKGEYTEYTYRQLWSDVETRANYFRSIGVKQGDVISILLPTCEEFLAVFFAAQLLKAIPVSLYPPQALSEVSLWEEKTKKMLSSVTSKFIVSNSKIGILCGKLIKDLNLAFINTDEKVPDSLKAIDKLVSLEHLEDTDICFLQFSSGTTGDPKAIIINQKNVLINTKIFFEKLNLDQKNCNTASWVPLYHDLGLVGTLLTTIIFGNKLVLIRPDDFIRKPILWLQAISDHKLSVTVAPNFAYGLVTKRIKKEQLKKLNLDLSSLKLSFCGAEMIYRETLDNYIEHLKEFGLKRSAIMPVYGMAEATLAVSLPDITVGMKFLKVNKKALGLGKAILDDKDGVEVCSLGKPFRTVGMRILNDRGEDLEEGLVGNIHISGPSLTQGFYNDDERTKLNIIDGWLDTGDQGFIFEGNLYLCGRVKDIMIIRGRNYHPTILEEKLLGVLGLRPGRVIVSSMFNIASSTEEVVVLAEVKSLKKLKIQKEDLIEQVKKIVFKEGLPLYKVELVSPGTLLRTSSGKLRRRSSLNLYKAGLLKKKKRAPLADFFVLAKTYLLGLKK